MPSQQQGGHGGGEAAAARLEPVVTEVVAALGFELDSLGVQQAGRRKLVRVVIDTDDSKEIGDAKPTEDTEDTEDSGQEPGTETGAGVDLDDIAEVSRAVSKALDEREDLLAGSYTLEVTSPGVDRPLTKPRHWRRAYSRLVRLRRTDGTHQQARVGVADDDGVALLVDGTLVRVGYSEIAAATVEVEFRRPSAAELKLLRGNTGGTKEDPK